MRASWSLIQDAKAGKTTCLKVKKNKPIPDSFSLIIGDAVHNLRSSLDQLMWEVLAPFSPDPEKVQFPFCKKADRLKSVIKNREAHLAGPQVIKAIEDAKPYPCSDNTLFGIHQMDIADKHKLLIEADQLTFPHLNDIPGIHQGTWYANWFDVSALKAGKDGVITSFDYTLPLTRAERRRRGVQKTLRAKREKVIPANFTIIFGAGLPFEGQRVIPVLLVAYADVQNVIDNFERILSP